MDFSQVALLLIVAAVFGVIAKFFKQPLLIGYIFAGLFLAATGLVKESSTLESFGQIGATLLLFLLGLEMDIGEISSFGKVVALSGVGQIAFTFLTSFLLIRLLGFTPLSAIYLAAALTFSSTIILVKLLSEKKDLASLYGRIAVGISLVQDFVVIAALMFLSGFGKVGVSLSEYLLITVKAVLLFASIWILSRKILPIIFDRFVSSSHELLYVVSIAWALGFAAFVGGPMGFTLEIGGLAAGLSLAGLSEHLQIASKTRPLRDFFLIIFFIFLGAKLMVGEGILALLPVAILISLFVLLIKPLMMIALLGLLGYRKRTAFLTAISLSQISEFSLILVATGFSLGHISASDASVVVVVGVLTMSISTYLILRADKIYKKVQKYLTIFERRHTQEEAYFSQNQMQGHVILVGCDRTGKSLSAYLAKENIPFVVVDFNPKVFSRVTAAKIPVVFGDINDPEVIERSHVVSAKMIISTISNLEDNLTLLECLRSLKTWPVTLFTASTRYEAIRLYEAGAAYVIVPEAIAGEHIRHILETYGVGSVRISQMGKSQFNRLIIK